MPEAGNPQSKTDVEVVPELVVIPTDEATLRVRLLYKAGELAANPRPKSADSAVAAIMQRVAADKEELTAYATALRAEGEARQAAIDAAKVPQTVTKGTPLTPYGANYAKAMAQRALAAVLPIFPGTP